MSDNKQPQFSKLRAALWPIEGWEAKKFIPMALMMAFILFNYSVLRGTKDALIITAGGSGVEVISFLKLYVVLPAAVLMMLIYAKLSNMLGRQALFYATILPFLAFFAVFALYLYPHRDALHPSVELIGQLKADYPNFQWLFPIYGYWTYSLFYVLSEMWGSVILSLLFWQFANQITRVTEAKRFYALFGFIGNLFVYFAGLTLEYFSDMRAHVPAGVDPWGQSLNYLCGAVVVCGLIVMVIYAWMNKVILTDERYYDSTEVKVKKKKEKVSLMEGFKHIFSSKYLGFIALLVICYGVTINLIEVTWKDQLKQLNPDPNAFAGAMGNVLKWIGLVTMAFMLVGANILRAFSWRTAALITPLMFALTGGVFFVFIMFKDTVEPWLIGFGFASLAGGLAWLGMIQNVMSKSSKYSLFDPTKEMAYIPLDEELKVKGKAAVDVVGGRLGKSGGALIQSTLLIVLAGGQADIVPFLGVMVIVMLGFWFGSVFGLSKLFDSKVAEQEKEHDKSKKAA